MNDTIYITGAGAVGKALAVYLKLNNKNVVIIRGSVDDNSKRMEIINVIQGNGTELKAEIEVSTLSGFEVLNGIVVLTNKSYGNKNLSVSLKDKIGNSPIVLLQNGLGIENDFIENGFQEIYRCVLFVTSQMLPVNKLSFKPVSASQVGIIKGNSGTLNLIVEDLNSPGFPFRAEQNIQAVIWKKAIINSVFNSVCPLLEVDNGIFHRNNEALEIAKRVIEECVIISAVEGVPLNPDEVVENLLLISKSSDGQLISTLQDIRNKRETEIDTLNFAIVNAARRVNKEHIVTETQLLGELTKLKADLAK